MAAWKIREATQFIDQIPLETREFPPPKTYPGFFSPGDSKMKFRTLIPYININSIIIWVLLHIHIRIIHKRILCNCHWMFGLLLVQSFQAPKSSWQQTSVFSVHLFEPQKKASKFCVCDCVYMCIYMYYIIYYIYIIHVYIYIFIIVCYMYIPFYSH